MRRHVCALSPEHSVCVSVSNVERTVFVPCDMPRPV
uniref:Uncharacterized protein n=1 Tax=Anguilla anguilla TaxID=7936 RepID=A0A0E9T182_ANGAN